MKWLFYIAIIFCFGSCSGQEVPSNDQALSNEILEEFIQYGLKNDFYARYHIEKHLKGVHFLPISEFKTILPAAPRKDGCVGLRVNYDLQIYENFLLVNSEYMDRKEVVRAIVFHELGHFFGLEHDNSVFPDIMNEILSAGYKLSDEDIGRLFKKIKRVAPSDYMLTIKY